MISGPRLKVPRKEFLSGGNVRRETQVPHRLWSVLVIALTLSCRRSCYLNSAEGPCLATVHVGTSDAGVPYRAEACGELLLRVDWDLDRNGTYDCRENQFVREEGAFVRSRFSWVQAPPDSGCPPP